MSNGIFGVALSGLNAAQLGMQTTGHNLSNVNTPGFSRQMIVQSQGGGQFSGAGFIGSGANVATIQRAYADFLVTQVHALQAQSSASAGHAAHLGRLSDMLSNSDTGLASPLNAFFASLQSLATNPGSSVNRQEVLAGAQSLASRFQAMGSMLEELQAGVDAQIRTSVDLINGYSQSVAQLNSAIAAAQGTGQEPNDLLDRRDALIGQMNEEVRAVVVPDGTINVFLTNGQPLVLGSSAQKLVLIRDDLDASKLNLAASNGVITQTFRQSDIAGGALGAALAFRDQGLVQARNELGRLAMAFAEAFNAQHMLGQDRNGDAGGAFFKVPEPQVNASIRNTGSAVLSAASSTPGNLSASDFMIFYDGGSYVVTRIPEGTQSTHAAMPLTIGGMSLSLASGTPAAGDRFLVQPTRAAAQGMSVAINDISRIAAAAPIRTSAGTGNRGDGRITVGTVESRDANLAQPVTIRFTSAGTFDVSGTGTGAPVALTFTPGAPISFNGWTVAIEGHPVAGDVFSVGPNPGATGDNRNALGLAGLAGMELIDGAAASSAYAMLVSRIGVKAQDMNISRTSQQSLFDAAKQSVASVSAVNLDEEAANLLRYQQAYQAAGKMISVANTLFDSLLQAVR